LRPIFFGNLFAAEGFYLRNVLKSALLDQQAQCSPTKSPVQPLAPGFFMRGTGAPTLDA
jgi:hypothetical protein